VATLLRGPTEEGGMVQEMTTAGPGDATITGAANHRGVVLWMATVVVENVMGAPGDAVLQGEVLFPQGTAADLGGTVPGPGPMGFTLMRVNEADPVGEEGIGKVVKMIGMKRT